MEVEKEKLEIRAESENVIKISITREAAETLAHLVSRANEGFEGGKINRQNLASYIIEKYKNNFSDRELAHLRQLHYDDAAMLEAMYKRMKDTGEIPEFLREALKKQFHGVDEPGKRGKKPLTRESINDGLDKVGDAA